MRYYNRITIILFSGLVILYYVSGESKMPLEKGCSEIHQCSQICRNNRSECACIDGFTLGESGKSCIPSVDPQLHILFGGAQFLGRIDRDSFGGKHTRMLLPENYQTYSKFVVKSLTYDARKETIYWIGSRNTTESSSGSANPELSNLNRFIFRSSISRIEQPKQLLTVIHITPSDIAYDWITGNLYFTDATLRQIIACRTDAQNMCALIAGETQGVSRPMSIALHPNLGIMFWTENGEPARIFRAGLDGSSGRPIVKSEVVEPMGITIDQGAARIYWADWFYLHIMSSDFNGDKIRVVTASSYGARLDILGDTLVWSDFSPPLIQSTNKLDGSQQRVHHNRSLGQIYDISAFNVANQPIFVEDPCKNNTQCAHICVLSPPANSSTGLHFRCPCPYGYKSAHDDKKNTDESVCLAHVYCNTSSCSPFQLNNTDNPIIDNYQLDHSDNLVIAFKNNLAITATNINETITFKRVFLQQIRDFTGVAKNYVNGSIILTDYKKIFQFDLTTNQLSVLVETGLQMVTAIDVDNVGQSLYWIDGGLNTVEMMSLNTRSKTTLLENMTNVCDILVLPDKNILFLIRRNDMDAADIYKYSLNDTKLISISHHPSDSLCPSSVSSKNFQLTYPTANSTLFRHISDLAYGGGAVKHGNSIYWVDSVSETLIRTELSFLRADNIARTPIHFLVEGEHIRGASAKVVVVSRNSNAISPDQKLNKKIKNRIIVEGRSLSEGLPVKVKNVKIVEDSLPNADTGEGNQHEGYDTFKAIFVCVVFGVLVVGVASYFVLMRCRKAESTNSSATHVVTFINNRNARLNSERLL